MVYCMRRDVTFTLQRICDAIRKFRNVTISHSRDFVITVMIILKNPGRCIEGIRSKLFPLKKS